MFLNILVGIDGSPASRRALEHSIDLARVCNSTLTLMTVTPPVSTFVTLAGVTRESLETQLDGWASRLLAEARASLPADVLAHTIQRHGDVGPQLVQELAHGNYDLVVLGSRGRGRTQEGLLGSVNAYVHFHTRVPLLSIPESGEEGPPGPLG